MAAPLADRDREVSSVVTMAADAMATGHVTPSRGTSLRATTWASLAANLFFWAAWYGVRGARPGQARLSTSSGSVSRS